ncbi:MAG: hypothetical protein N3D80_12510 [Ignavibacterium album]|jgi:hypothetical protein|uniref:Uncharacterized protein n=1 Tax=Ignavibacterium album TaxID=591197 RepID=A0A7V2ZHC0_9BACT|nr:hypothetical protein [Ignavibacterium album]MCX8106681.1 hypothetical protein [Ignavibacterium album]
MKTLLITILIATGLAFAQTSQDTVKNKETNREQVQTQVQQKEMLRTQERIGSKENPEDGKNLNRPRMDVFVDKDGDGICDNRQSGMSFNKIRNRKGSGTQKGPGGPHGYGGGSGNNSQQQNQYHGGK